MRAPRFSLSRARARAARQRCILIILFLRRFLFVSGSLPTTGTLLRELYANFCDADGFLYALYAAENTFGAA